MTTPLDVRLSRLAGRAALAVLAWAALALELAPLGAAAGAGPAPDAVFCMAAVVAARRPRLAPPVLVFALGLLRDILSGGPLGLGALALMLSVEAMRAREPAIRRRGWAVEGPLAAAVLALALAGQAVLLAVSGAGAPEAGELALRYALTVALYPVAAVAVGWPLRRAAAREART